MSPTPQEKMQNPNVAPQQGKEEALNNAKEQIRQLMQQANLNPDQLVYGGQLAQRAIQDKAMYPVAVKAAVQAGLIQPNQVPEGIDYKFLAAAVSAGKIAQMIKDGK